MPWRPSASDAVDQIGRALDGLLEDENADELEPANVAKPPETFVNCPLCEYRPLRWDQPVRTYANRC